MEALGQLTGGIAHDFNNLLTVVVGGLDIITKRADEPKLKRYAENALAAAERGARLTGQLLAFSRVQRLEVQPTYVAPLIENMRPLLSNVLGPGITKQFDLDQAMMPVMADPTQLEVAVLNLAINARDAMPDGGVLSFSTQAGAGRRRARPRARRLCRADHRRHRRRACRRKCSTAPSSPSSRPRRSARAPALACRWSTAWRASRAARRGSRARRAKARPSSCCSARPTGAVSELAAGVEEPQAPLRRSRPLSILVVDDDPDVRGFIVEALEEQGYIVREAADGREGIAEVEREAPDLIVLDFIMPGLSGRRRRAPRRARRPDQPILFVSGYSETDAVKRTAPDAPLLAKPFRAEALAQSGARPR